ncbi:hypothetical protein QA601_10640 [Chitinispirillales bacterium ANBcel5]|uniref:hypothetical protein n=1 Tax=Cellulosispirillum alkaliphilum TaxID=3039283 RepID=UPI002A512700|nr:hypothetical protein [Chitinispirillales bacterium ANBcel5]
MVTIEFLGLPGTGKTTLVKEICNRVNDSENSLHFTNALEHYTNSGRHKRLFIKTYSVINEILTDPRKFFREFRIIYDSVQLSIKDFFIVLLNFSFISHILRKNKGHILLDQGLYQAVWSINISAKKYVPIKTIIPPTLKPDLVFYICANDHIINKRIENRDGINLRMNKKLTDVTKLKNIADRIIQEIEENNVKIIKLQNNKTDQIKSLSQSVIETIKEQLKQEIC